MPDDELKGRRVLVVEDEYVLAVELSHALVEAGATVVGPVGALEEALAIIRADAELDAAVIDVNLRGELTFPAADLLAERGVPFVFATGYDASVLPVRFRDVARCEKPLDLRRVAAAVSRAIGAHASGAARIDI